MKRILGWMFSAPERPELARVVWWWEVRRIPFNVLIGTYGLVCYVLFAWTMDASGQLQPGEDAVEPMALLMVPVGVNLLYTLGWMVELPLRLIWPRLPARVGPSLLKAGTGLGLFLCSVPAILGVGEFLFHRR